MVDSAVFAYPFAQHVGIQAMIQCNTRHGCTGLGTGGNYLLFKLRRMRLPLTEKYACRSPHW